VGWDWVHLVRRPLFGIVYQPRMTSVDQSVEWELAGVTEVLGKNLPQSHFAHHKSQWPDLGSNPGRRGGKPATERLSYGTAPHYVNWHHFLDTQANEHGLRPG
jgi:hypothetical protein